MHSYFNLMFSFGVGALTLGIGGVCSAFVTDITRVHVHSFGTTQLGMITWRNVLEQAKAELDGTIKVVKKDVVELKKDLAEVKKDLAELKASMNMMICLLQSGTYGMIPGVGYMGGFTGSLFC